MSDRQEFKQFIREYNKSVGVPQVHDLAKKLFPDAFLMDMGYDGSYSHRLVGNKLTYYDGKPFKEEDVPANFDKYINEHSDDAFGTIQIMTKDGKSHQIYHVSQEDGGHFLWYDDTFDDNAKELSEANDQVVIGGTRQVLDYLQKLKEQDK